MLIISFSAILLLYNSLPLRNIKKLKMKGLRIGNLAIAVPIIQGGMGVGISLSGLASAVANEGGVGVISSAGLGFYTRIFHRLS